MGYYVRGDRLGMSTTQTALVSAGANAIIPGSGPIVAVGAGLLTNLFGGAGRDAQRQARVDWFTQGARQGSLTAARVLFGGIANTAGNESPMWQRAVDTLSKDSRYNAIMTAAANASPYWDTHDDNSSSAMRAIVENELAALGTSMASATPATSRTSVSGSPNMTPMLPTGRLLPTVTTTAPYNYTPYLIGGGILLGALLLAPGRRTNPRRSSRRRR